MVRLAQAPTEAGLASREIWLLRFGALLARARGDATSYMLMRDEYRDMAKSRDLEGHMRGRRKWRDRSGRECLFKDFVLGERNWRRRCVLSKDPQS